MNADWWDARAQTYDALGWVNNADLLEWTAARILALAGQGPLYVQEVGCGTGAMTERLALLLPKWRRAKFAASDPSRAMVSRAMLRFQEPGCTADPPVYSAGLHGTFNDPEIPARWEETWINIDDEKPHREPVYTRRGWDVVASRMVLHHAEDPAQEIRRWMSVLQPGGILAVAEGPPPVLDPEHPAMALYRLGLGLKEPGRHIFSAASIGQWMLEAGATEITTWERWTYDNSVRNWLQNAGAAPGMVDDLLAMHRCAAADPAVREAYRAEVTEDGDVLMRWRHCVVVGKAP